MAFNAQKLGNLGEKALQYLCAQYSIVATRTDEDRLGWDYFLEIPSSSAQNQAQDKPSPMLRCLVQIKATTSHKQRIQVKATAIKPLIDADLPAFIILFEFKNLTLHRAYARHIDKQIIERTLRRLRHSHTTVQKRRQNPGELTISFGSANQFDIARDDALAHKLWSYVPADLSQYLDIKNQQRKWIGYDSIPINLTIQSSRNPIVELIEHDLGLIDQLNVPQFTLRDRRFGVEVEEPLIQLIKGKMRLQPHTPSVNEAAAFTFTVDPQDQTLTFTAKHRWSHFNAWVSAKDQRFRLSGGWFDILVCPFSEDYKERIDSGPPVISGKGSIRINQDIKTDEVYTGDLLLKLVRASHNLATSESMHFIFWFDSSRTLPFESKLSGITGFPQMNRELLLLESLNDILSENDIDLSTCSLSLNDLYSQAEEINFFGGVATNSLRGTQVYGRFDPHEEADDNKNLIPNLGAWLSVGMLSFKNCDLIVAAGMMLTDVTLDVISQKISAQISETQLICIMPLMGKSLPTRSLGKHINGYLAERNLHLVIGQFRPSANSLRVDSPDFERTLFYGQRE